MKQHPVVKKLCKFQHKVPENENEQCPVLHLQAKPTAKSYPCEKCNFVFATKGKFHIHLSSIQHNISEKQTDSEYEDSDIEDDEEYLDIVVLF